MQKAYLNPTPDQTFEVIGDGPYNFTRVLAHTRELEAAGNVEDACNERYQAFQRLDTKTDVPDDTPVVTTPVVYGENTMNIDFAALAENASSSAVALSLIHI